MTSKQIFLTSFAATALALAGAAHATTFKVAVGDAQGGTQWELGTNFKAAFETKTGGKHKVDLFPNGQLGSEEATVNDAQHGHAGLLDPGDQQHHPVLADGRCPDPALRDPER